MRPPDQRIADDAAQDMARCPPWCVTAHRVQAGEEDWVHASAPHDLGRTAARLCVTVHPDGFSEEPVVLIGGEEYSLEEAAELARAILVLTAAGEALSVRAAP